jgi:hypothetical protein
MSEKTYSFETSHLRPKHPGDGDEPDFVMTSESVWIDAPYGDVTFYIRYDNATGYMNVQAFDLDGDHDPDSDPVAEMEVIVQ